MLLHAHTDRLHSATHPKLIQCGHWTLRQHTGVCTCTWQNHTALAGTMNYMRPHQIKLVCLQPCHLLFHKRTALYHTGGVVFFQ